MDDEPPPVACSACSSGENNLVVVHDSSIHNLGVYARQTLPKGTRIIEYVGRKLTKAESDLHFEKVKEEYRQGKRKGMVYLFELNEFYDLDGEVPGNTARLINHSCDPNCWIDIINDRIWIFAKRDIDEGEELTFNYGYDLEDDFEEHPCKCGSPRCVGYIVHEKHWDKLRQILRQRELTKHASSHRPRHTA